MQMDIERFYLWNAPLLLLYTYLLKKNPLRCVTLQDLINGVVVCYHTGHRNERFYLSNDSPLQMPQATVTSLPWLHSSPLWWSQGLMELQSWLSCAAHTLQQPHPSGTKLTPGGQIWVSAEHLHTGGQLAITWGGQRQASVIITASSARLLQGSWRNSSLLTRASSFQLVGINMLALLKTGGRE